MLMTFWILIEIHMMAIWLTCTFKEALGVGILKVLTEHLYVR